MNGFTGDDIVNFMIEVLHELIAVVEARREAANKAWQQFLEIQKRIRSCTDDREKTKLITEAVDLSWFYDLPSVSERDLRDRLDKATIEIDALKEKLAGFINSRKGSK